MALYSAYMNEFKIALQTLVHYEKTSQFFCKTISVRYPERERERERERETSHSAIITCHLSILCLDDM